MADYQLEYISDHHHKAFLDWQTREFPELRLLTENWDTHFHGQTPFVLAAKISGLKSDLIEHGRFQGRRRMERARDMGGNMFYTAKGIIRAQCSTEFGSIQQHRETLERAHDNEAQHAILRIMAEELRHAYQMFWVLDRDPTWKRPGHGDVARETVEELLAMRTGDHVLDAFNMEFANFLDNAMFAAVIDLVGKYQLDMQRTFSYAPMARSMGPMFSEEGFHLATGRRFLRLLAGEAAAEKGEFSLDAIQRAINTWYPRGLEMFGNEAGGATNVDFGFKDRTNAAAQAQYIEEVEGIVLDANIEIARVRHEKLSRPQLKDLVQDVATTREPSLGLKPEDLLRLPDRKFNRKRGSVEFALEPVDTDGKTITEGGQPVSGAAYFQYLERRVTPQYFHSSEFEKFKSAWEAKHAGEIMAASAGW
ncbi:MAG: phenylacetate-CoA oxygenase subunit PaaI [Planctomycetes bacterium]|nr:phenylacetate-CoA oxygenase subunit PaaI [Planctomycetota bacterium]